MKKKLIWLGGIIVVLFIIGSWFLGAYNSMVTQNEQVTTSWAEVQTQYQRRFDLIPNLVAATKGYLKQEQAVFGAIAEARTKYAGAPAGSNEQVVATNQYEGALARLLVIMENYPVLKSDVTVRALTDELAGTENRVAVVRDRYNGQVQVYNVMIKRVPGVFFASVYGFDEREFFKSVEDASTAPVVNLE